MASPTWVLDMNLVQDKVDNVARAAANKIEREWPQRFAHLAKFASGFFSLSVRMARITFRTVCYLSAEVRLTEYDWRWYYTLALPALNRTILDSIFNVIFMLEDLESRSGWYFKSGFREAEGEYERFSKTYGADPQWAPWLTGRRGQLDQGHQQLGVAQSDVATTPWWPNPGKMIFHGIDPNKPLPPDRAFLQYLNDWFYRETSAQNHQSFFGFLHLGGLLASDVPGLTDEQRQRVESEFYPRHRAVQVARSVTLLLCLISEIEHYFDFGLSPTIVELWTILADRVPEAKEVYDRRYAIFWPVLKV